MKGLWTWPSEPEEQTKIIRKILGEDELATILVSLGQSSEGLSNAQLDKLLRNDSQWRTLSHTRELAALGFIQYQIPFFGEAGRYHLTELGRSVLPRLQTGR